MDFDWFMNIGFTSEEERLEFLRNLKGELRDYWYQQVIKKTGEKLSNDAIKPPITGELRIFITEAKNLGIKNFRQHIEASAQRRMTGDKLNITLNFRAPNSVEDVFKSVFVDKSVVDAVQSTFKANNIVIEHDIAEDPSWSSPEKPAGELRSMGQVAEMPKSNAFLTITLSAPYEENGTPQEYVFGSAEYFLFCLLTIVESVL